jgi:hypothetical protein
MRKLVAAGLLSGALFTALGGQASGAPADQGNCISNQDNGGAAGARNSAFAGPEFGPFVADFLGGGTLGAAASDPGCRRP